MIVVLLTFLELGVKLFKWAKNSLGGVKFTRRGKNSLGGQK